MMTTPPPATEELATLGIEGRAPSTAARRWSQQAAAAYQSSAQEVLDEDLKYRRLELEVLSARAEAARATAKAQEALY